MNTHEELLKKVRDAIFLSALGSWEESCTFDELSEEGRQVYEDYAKAAIEVLKDELKSSAGDMAKLRADLEQIADSITAATQASRTSEAEIAKLRDELRATIRQETAMEGAGCDAIAALRAVSSNPGLTEAQHALVASALLGMFEAKPRWLSRPAKSPSSEAAA